MSVIERLPFVGGEEPSTAPFLERAARWACDLEYRDVPRHVRRAATAQLTSTVGAGVWTLSHPLGERIAARVNAGQRGHDAPFLGGDGRSVADAAAGNAALSTALEFDDEILGGPLGRSSVWVPLAYAEATGADGERTLVAQVAANEIAGRLAAATVPSPFRDRRIPYAQAAGAAVGRGVVEGDDPETLASALASALSQPARSLEASALGSESAVWSASGPIRTGLDAVDIARAGLSGAVDLVEADEGLLASVADRPLPAFLDGFGERWHTRALTVAAHPVDADVAAPVEAALQVRGRFDRGRTSVERVDVHASLFTTATDERAAGYLAGPESPPGALSRTVPFNVAVALVDGEHTPVQVGTRLGDAAIWRLAERVSVHQDGAFTRAAMASEVPVGAMVRGMGPSIVADAATHLGLRTTLRNLPTLLRFVRSRGLPTDLSTAEGGLGARVEVTTTDGRTVEATIDRPTGFAGGPLAELRAVARKKCHTGLQSSEIRESTARERVDRLLSLHEADRVSLGWLLDGGDRG